MKRGVVLEALERGPYTETPLDRRIELKRAYVCADRVARLWLPPYLSTRGRDDLGGRAVSLLRVADSMTAGEAADMMSECWAMTASIASPPDYMGRVGLLTGRVARGMRSPWAGEKLAAELVGITGDD